MWLATGRGQMRNSEDSVDGAYEGDEIAFDDSVLSGLVDQLKAAKSKASPKSQAVISRMVGLAERGELDDRSWTLINDLLTELSRK